MEREIDRTERERILKKGAKVLKSSGIYEAHQELMASLFNHGLPIDGDIYEYSALQIEKFQKQRIMKKNKEL